MNKNKVVVKNELPKGILKTDLEQISYKHYDKEVPRDLPYEDRSFELWFVTSFGWCIPTLLISTGRRRGTTDRTYAVRVKDKGVVRIGKGPHVLETHTVHVRKARVKELQPFLDIRREGAANAGQIRDRISSRRAQGQMERAAGNRFWRWDV